VPKFFLMRGFEELVREFGGAALASTDFGERSHKLMKRQAQFTNHHSQVMTAQVRIASWAVVT
jgi:hypothetical protein